MFLFPKVYENSIPGHFCLNITAKEFLHRDVSNSSLSFGKVEETSRTYTGTKVNGKVLNTFDSRRHTSMTSWCIFRIYVHSWHRPLLLYTRYRTLSVFRKGFLYVHLLIYSFIFVSFFLVLDFRIVIKCPNTHRVRKRAYLSIGVAH